MTKHLPAHSERLWAELQSNLINFTKTLVQIIEVEAWKPAYESFFEAWDDRMSSITFGAELRPLIAYQMFNEGRTPEEVAKAIKGVSPDSAQVLKEQLDDGVPAELATTVVRSYRRKLPSKCGWLHIKVDHEELMIWHQIAGKQNRRTQDIAYEAVKNAFNSLKS
jgi:hypothetical protein